MTRTIGLTALLLAALFAWQTNSVWSMLHSCSVRAREIIAEADPLDRNTPPQVAAFIEHHLPLERMIDYLATTLLDHYACNGRTGWRETEWLIEQPFLARHLRTTFGKREIIALFAATAREAEDEYGMSGGARRMFHADLSQVDDTALYCLVNKPFGQALARSQNPAISGYYFNCLSESPPPPPVIQ